MQARAFFNTLTFLILFIVAVLAIITSFHTMSRFVNRLEQTPSPTPAQKTFTVAQR